MMWEQEDESTYLPPSPPAPNTLPGSTDKTVKATAKALIFKRLYWLPIGRAETRAKLLINPKKRNDEAHILGFWWPAESIAGNRFSGPLPTGYKLRPGSKTAI